jgi:hypothetical protein
MVTVFWNSEGVVLTDFWLKVVTVNPECWNKTLKKNLKKHVMRKRAEIDIFLEQHSAMPHTSSATTDAIARLGLQSTHIQPIPITSLLAIFTCS